LHSYLPHARCAHGNNGIESIENQHRGESIVIISEIWREGVASAK